VVTPSESEGTKERPPWWKRIHPEHVLAALALVGVGLCWRFGWWTFADRGPLPLSQQKDPGIAQYLLGDPAVLALVQIAVGVFALFFAVSFPVHLWNRRWVRGLTKEGFGLDDSPVDAQLAAAMEEISRLIALNSSWERFSEETASRAGVPPPA
jgi:hypothetical protein